MAKAPVAGRVKTRLAAEAGLAVALRFARHRTTALVQRMQGGGGWHTLLAVTPDAALPARIWPPGVPLLAQGGGDLGARMQRLMDLAPPGPVVIVGTDIPDIAPAHIAAAFRLLGRHHAVLGPAADGGYWLVGLKRRPHVLRPFAGVRWSTVHALADTLANLRRHSVALLPTLGDVDTAHDLAAHAGSLGRHIWQSTIKHPISIIP
ncbi:MAG TPA: TIGR04282 family arsenosugar biosynthesis glycosyltransferase [Hyphomicrobiaceae bacterium]|nr:TIGR04282 family arsenosugar biosynthesis glycosyltransferase [Hyphomicrobiaceae bacterium]